jgi:AraC-like DNA-binding protein
MKRNKKGQFIHTTGGGKYKRKNVKGHNLQYSRYIWEKYYGKIPEGNIIHHIDENKMNNNIKNLQCLTYQEHNLLHMKDRDVWNKGLTKETSIIFKESHEKAQKNRLKITKKRFIETYKLRLSGLTLQQIANELNISRRQVSGRLRRFKELSLKT